MPSRPPPRHAALVALALCACGVDPAPADLDGALKWLWRNQERGADAQVVDAIVKLDAAINDARGGELTETFKARVAALDEEDAAAVEPAARGDLALATGMVTADPVKCGLLRVEELLIALDQNAIFGGYEKYVRAYTSDDAAYRARRTPFLTWTTDYTVSALGITYDATILGEARFVPAPERPGGGVMVQRAWLVEPGKFNNPDDFFRQDYQVHVVYERKPGEVVRVVGLWRDMRFAGFDTTGDVMVEFTLSGIARTNRKLEEHCAK